MDKPKAAFTGENFSKLLFAMLLDAQANQIVIKDLFIELIAEQRGVTYDQVFAVVDEKFRKVREQLHHKALENFGEIDITGFFEDTK